MLKFFLNEVQTRWRYVNALQHSRFKMASLQEQAQVLAWFIEFKSAAEIQRKFRTTCNRSPPSRPTIYEWHERFMTTDSLLPKPKSDRPNRSFSDVKRIQETFHRSSRKPIRIVE
ncbi:hypothetical protein AVEN_57939-1 [Araneus ventricosus]|uniref:Uncharacterized protein n=1 Tax=Araneus ventricosus TaxID=182803 RepID=A0A4Y2NC11_ARAVE|nr:hypothetical protein AVEN_57939-1 [Araneus ventricosus]